jgi:hypothetical protein
MSKDIESRASKGGKARAKVLNKQERRQIAQKAIQARWDAIRKQSTENKPISIHPYTELAKLKIQDLELPCAVLEDRTPVIAYPSVRKTLGRSTGGKQLKLAQASISPMPDFLYGQALEPFVPESLRVSLRNPILFRAKGGVRKGVHANLIPEICEVWLKARDAGVLRRSQLRIATNAEVLMRGLARVGITALIYEATGYELVKDRDDLHRILEAYISKELLPWTKRFPDEFYEQLFKLKGWQYNPPSVKRPKIVGKLTVELVYDRLPKGVLEELRNKNPVTPRGYRKYHHHRFLTEDIGNPHLEKQVAAVTTLMKASNNWATFNRLFNRVFGIQSEMVFPELEEGKG